MIFAVILHAWSPTHGRPSPPSLGAEPWRDRLDGSDPGTPAAHPAGKSDTDGGKSCCIGSMEGGPDKSPTVTVSRPRVSHPRVPCPRVPVPESPVPESPSQGPPSQIPHPRVSHPRVPCPRVPVSESPVPESPGPRVPVSGSPIPDSPSLSLPSQSLPSQSPRRYIFNYMRWTKNVTNLTTGFSFSWEIYHYSPMLTPPILYLAKSCYIYPTHALI